MTNFLTEFLRKIFFGKFLWRITHTTKILYRGSRTVRWVTLHLKYKDR